MKNAVLFFLSLGVLFTLSLGHNANATQLGLEGKASVSAANSNIEMAPDKPNPKSIKIRIKKISLKGVPASIHAIRVQCYAYANKPKGPGNGGALYGGGSAGGGETIDQRNPDKQTKPFDVEGGPYDVTLYPNSDKSAEMLDPIKHAACGLIFFVHSGPTMMVGDEPSYQGDKLLEGADISGSWKFVKNFP